MTSQFISKPSVKKLTGRLLTGICYIIGLAVCLMIVFIAVMTAGFCYLLYLPLMVYSSIKKAFTTA